jgi:CRISPR/Cas system-associated exonuclease Cas4 (RecB family)
MTLSPSAMEAYIRCPLRFYYGTVLGLEERPALADDADAGVLGSVIHSVLEKFYRDIELSGSWQDYRSRIDRLLSTEMRCQGFTVETGVRRIRHWATLEKLIDFVRVDVARMREGNVEILDLEKTFEHEFDIPGLDNRLKTRGRIDRIEVEGDVLRLIDYKTGSRFTVSVGRKAEEWRFRSFHLLPEDEYLPALAQLSSAYKNFQLLFYLLLAHHCLDRKFEDLEAVYCFLQHADGFHRPVFAMRGEIDKVKVMERFSEILGDVFRDLCLRERFLPNRSDPHHCGYCPFVGLCGG